MKSVTLKVGTGLCLNKQCAALVLFVPVRIFCNDYCNLYIEMKVKGKLTFCKASRINHWKIQNID